ncbi:TetR/AcrR family transcriptional regulator [Tenggerimyces flavus]|uniref:TetR/AcrR family transcriptional regulator n=1 Tax=Tenggerimyces flavus TaxID=1708749 RepID=A0ABV7Y984_9ACTN|nr:TetR family transcriptional regulator [Tenggerimyces flavus]MBM7788219.1 AcrR family transcriptional regulator [Tenggerimyces flavus]
MTTRAERREQTRQRILDAARSQFAEVGYDRATVRAVAKQAEVDPALVMQHFGSKDELFKQATQIPEQDLPDDPDELVELCLDLVGAKLSDGQQDAANALLRSMFTHPDATETLRDTTNAQIANFAKVARGRNAELRGAILLSALLGISIGRNLLKLNGLADAKSAELTKAIRGTVEGLVSSPGSPARSGTPARRSAR